MRLIAALAAALTLALISPALAHDSWINRGGYVNKAGERCCGHNDCFALEPGDVSTTASGGYYIRSLTEIVPEDEVLKSRDSFYWRCRKPDGSRRCFFVPQPST